MKQTSKAQAALEYLTTYGWALIALLAVIGSLVYFGASDTNKAIPTSCTFGTEFICEGYLGAKDGSFAFAIINNQRAAIDITALECMSGEETWTNTYLTEPTMAVGEEFIFFCDADDASGALAPGDKDKFSAKLYFAFNETEALPRVQSGSIVATVVEKSSSTFQSYVVNSVS